MTKELRVRHNTRHFVLLQQKIRLLKKATSLHIEDYDFEKGRIQKETSFQPLKAENTDVGKSTRRLGDKTAHASASEGPSPASLNVEAGNGLNCPAASNLNGGRCKRGIAQPAHNWNYLPALIRKTNALKLSKIPAFPRTPACRSGLAGWSGFPGQRRAKPAVRVLVKPKEKPLSKTRLAELATPVVFSRSSLGSSRESRVLAKPRSICQLRSLTGDDYRRLVKTGLPVNGNLPSQNRK